MADLENNQELPAPTPPEPVWATLAEMLAAITPENIHPECDFGPPVGAELQLAIGFRNAAEPRFPHTGYRNDLC